MADAIDFSICIEMIFRKESYSERIDKVANKGFKCVEFWDWRDKSLDELQRKLGAKGMKLTNFSGNRNSSPISRKDRNVFLNEIKESSKVANQLGSKNIMVLSDELMNDNSAKRVNLEREEKLLNLYEALQEAIELVQRTGITILLEPLNNRDHPGYFLFSSQTAFNLAKSINSQNLKILFDIYHAQMAGGNIISTIKKNIGYIGYFHFADVPGRGEPGTGELNFHNILKAIDETGTTCTIGFEFMPTKSSVQSLTRIREAIRNDLP